jgi:hypothetical protein
MGLFDNNNQKFNDAIPNYDVDDGVDIVKCDSDCEGCKWRDVIKDRCLFETCLNNQFPCSISCHSVFHFNCEICDTLVRRDTSKINPMFPTLKMSMCDICISKLKKMVNEND